MVVSRLKILLLKKQPTLIQYSLVQVYHKRGLIDSRYSVFFLGSGGSVLDHIFQQAVKRLPILCEMLRYLDTDFPH